MFKIYRIVHIIWTAIFAFYVSIPILESGSLEKTLYVDALFVLLWILGVIFLFIKKLTKIGFIFTILPLLYAIVLFVL
ncbi:hypothetical protein ACH0B5_12490 [Ureibacillus sp. 179-F W5.1 NHS]|uniref:Uncharacterized protein n=1 Tax=Lysinibacillus halotolerans TaxID=1368476 RepID=A0A3M8H4V2_9BACI|nr:hypothetical protein [Lysinibacillus halotolerans]RNC97423.1 hypothetical protein EC501_15335 [Lysinibacillus halotolerans]